MAVEKRIDVVIGGRKDGSLDSTIGGVKASLGSMQGGQTLGGLSQGGTKLLEGGLRLGAISMAAQGMVGAMELAKAGLELMSGNFDGVNDALQKLPMGLGQAFKAAEELGVAIADKMTGFDKTESRLNTEARNADAARAMSIQFVEAEKAFRRDASRVGLSPRDLALKDADENVAKLLELFNNAPSQQQGSQKLLSDAIEAARELGAKKVSDIDKKLADAAAKEANEKAATLEKERYEFDKAAGEIIQKAREAAKEQIQQSPQAFQGSSLSFTGSTGATAADRVATAAEKSADLAAETVAILRDVRASLGGRSIYDSVAGV